MKLQIKVPILVIAILLIIGIFSSVVLLYSLERASFKEYNEMAESVTGAVQGCLELCMLGGGSHHIQKEVNQIAEKDLVKNIVIALPDGAINISSDSSQIGETMATDLIQPAMQSGEVDIFSDTRDNQRGFMTITPIFNKPACQSCHKAEPEILGAILVDLNTTTLDRHVKELIILIAILGGFTFIFTGIGLAIAIRKTVLKPLSILSETASKLSKGNYSARTINNKNDELGILSRTFNDMANNVQQRSQELEASHRELAQLNMGLEERVRQKTKELSTLNEVLTVINQCSEEEELVNTTLTRILNATELAAGMIHMIDKKSNKLVCVSQKGLSGRTAVKMRNEAGENIQEQAFRSKEVIVVNDCNHTHEAYSMTGEEGKYRSCISLPIKSEDNILGTLSLASYTSERFDSETTRMLSIISGALGIALENSRATQSIKEANKVREQLLEKLISAQEEERRRIARELHDEASQSLAALALNLENISDDLPVKYRDARTRLTTLKEQAIQTLGSVRNLALELRPSALDDLGLTKATEWFTKDYLNKRGIDTEIKITDSIAKLPPYTETMLFRIVQEALTNVVKHAGASKVKLTLELSSSKVNMQIEDNGKGFESELVFGGDRSQQTLGIHGMAERVALLGGTFSIRSQPGIGTYICVEVPLIEVIISNE
ncbi:GAF domain-containing protein [Chloroflexota bacterium]